MRTPLLLASLSSALWVGPAAAQGPTPADAAEVVRQFDALCRADGGRLWGESLCGPLMLVDPETRTVTTNQAGAGDALRPEGGLFVGTLPKEVAAANTAVEFDGVTWTMVLRPLPTDEHARAALLMHEAWHRIQKKLGFQPSSPAPDHLATPTGRTWMRMEWRALAAALGAADEPSRRLADALAFREARRALSADAAGLENQLELNEGLAEYTGVVLSGRSDAAGAVIAQLRTAEAADSFVRNFAYSSGPAYGLLLDKADPSWRARLRRDTGDRDLARLLASAFGVRATPIEDARGRYGYAQVAADEAARHELHEHRAAAWRDQLVAGPTLRLPLREMKISFNPQKVFPLPPHGTVYPGVRVADRWGVLHADDGALIASDWRTLTVPAPTTQTPNGVSGPGWTLDLAPGWRIDVTEPGRSALVETDAR